MHLLDLGKKVKEGVIKAGLVGYQFNTIGVRYPTRFAPQTYIVMEFPWERLE